VPSFGQILQSISTAWTDRRSEVESTATRMIEALRGRRQRWIGGEALRSLSGRRAQQAL